MPTVCLSRSLSKGAQRRIHDLLLSFDPNIRFAQRENEPGISLIVFNPRTELAIKRRPDCLAVTHQSLKEMKQRRLDPFSFSLASKTVLNLALMGVSVAFVNIRSSHRLRSLVSAMCGTVDDSVTASTNFVITDDRSAGQCYAVPVVHASWLEVLMKDSKKPPDSFMVPLQRQLSQPKQTTRGINPLKLEEEVRPQRPVDISLSQTRIQSAFFASPLRQRQDREGVAQSQCALSVGERMPTEEKVTPETPSPRLMKVCAALMSAPLKPARTKIQHSPISIAELDQFTQALDDDEEDVLFHIEYDQRGDERYIETKSQERDPLLDLFRGSQTWSQFG
jgi:hypothetical protein